MRHLRFVRWTEMGSPKNHVFQVPLLPLSRREKCVSRARVRVTCCARVLPMWLSSTESPSLSVGREESSLSLVSRRI